MNISLCMIAKDEEKLITNCLRSTIGLVDEIIIVDTGSIDNTMQIAKDFGAKIYTTPWMDNFSVARNISLEHATGEWILYLDCDEEVIVPNIADIKYLLKSATNIKGYNLDLINVIDNSFVANFNSLRMFKNKEGFHFKNPIHEQILPSIINKYGNDSIQTLPMSILHYGYNDNIIKEKQKTQRNLRILNSLESKDSYTCTMIGNEYLYLKDYKKAIEYYQTSLKLDSSFTQDHSIPLSTNYISSLVNLNMHTDALKIINLVRSKLPQFKDLYFLEFWALFNLSQYELALEKLNKYTSISNNSNYIEFKKYENTYNIDNLKNITLSKINTILNNH